MPETGIKLDISYLEPFVTKDELERLAPDVEAADKKLLDGSGLGSDYLGWVNPSDIAPDILVGRVNQTADWLRENSDCMVVIGIGGSYLGARAVIEALSSESSKPVYFAGTNMSGRYHSRLLKQLEGKRVAINVISKSGTTTEPAVAFRIIRQWHIQTHGAKDSAQLIIATTDERKGALLQLATQSGYKTFVVPDDVGGRFSVLSPVGLLPIAYSGIDISGLVNGAVKAWEKCNRLNWPDNPVYQYAAARNALYERGYNIELLSHFEPCLKYVAEWWKQLYGESEGKDGRGLFPASLDLTADLHSLGQYAQQGRRFLLETFVTVDGGGPTLKVPSLENNEDGMNYLANRELDSINREAYRATALAHWEGGVPNMTFSMEKLDAVRLGALLYTFERACGVSGYLLRVNPFDQPGVEAYKKHMFALLGKPGYEEHTQELKRRLEYVRNDTKEN